MIEHQLLEEERILIVRLLEEICSEDLVSLGWLIDRRIEQHGELKGLLIELGDLGGVDGLEGFAAWVHFVTEYLPRIERWATTSKNGADAPFNSEVPMVRDFGNDERDRALAWLAGTN
ncbi:MAG: SpoIIAA family protein [Planctomycetota bacterium]